MPHAAGAQGGAPRRAGQHAAHVPAAAGGHRRAFPARRDHGRGRRGAHRQRVRPAAGLGTGAADPLRLPAAVGGDGSAWGDFDDRDCPHTKPEKSAARRSLTVAHENNAGWRTYLDRQHSNTSHALCVCATTCHRRCTVYRRLDARQAEVVTHGCRLAAALNESAVVKLRHSAPVGHGFGVPSQRELLDAWARTRASLAKHDPAIAQEDGYPLPGFAAYVAVLAGTAMPPDTLLADTAIELAKALTP
jgi:hypothetical protein